MFKSNKISLYKLHNNDVDEWLDFAWHYSKARFKAAFEKIGVGIVDESDVLALSKLAKTKGDVNGELKTRDKKSIYFKVLDIVKSIEDDREELANKFIPTKGHVLIKVDKRRGIS